MALTIHNTLTGTQDEIIPGGVRRERISDYPPVTIYSCGPTVYSYSHIGNFRTFIFNDLLRRYLKFRGFRINHAMNKRTLKTRSSPGRTAREYPSRNIPVATPPSSLKT
jgi:cysteinyl-tRNA synthetase